MSCGESTGGEKPYLCTSGGIPEIARLSEIVEFFPAGNTDALAEKMNLALARRQNGGRTKVLDASKTRRVSGAACRGQVSWGICAQEATREDYSQRFSANDSPIAIRSDYA